MANNNTIAIATKHPDYLAWEREWEKCRDCFDGQSAVKRKGQLYLPRLSGQTDKDYNAYKYRALFYSITSKSVSSLTGMVTTKTPNLLYTEEMNYIFEDKGGVQFYEILTRLLTENILISRVGLLCDRKEGGKATVSIYDAESILNWDLDEEGKPIFVVLRERVVKPGLNKFDSKAVFQYRLLEIVDGVYQQTIYNELGEPSKPIIVLNTGRPMNYIPFFAVNSFGVDFRIVKPSMLDVVDINLSHYRTSADLENGRHYAGIPTAVVTGGESSAPLKIGGTEAWVIPNKDAKAFYMEFKGEGLKSLENALKEKEVQLASMSARMSSSGNGSEAAETVRLRYMSETASLSSIARAVEAGLNIAYKTVAEMGSIDPNSVSIKLDKEFLSTRMSAAEVLKLTESYLSGGMSVETYVFNLRRGDQIPMDRTDEVEIESLEAAKEAILAQASK